MPADTQGAATRPTWDEQEGLAHVAKDGECRACIAGALTSHVARPRSCRQLYSTRKCMQCNAKKAMQQFAHGSAVAAAKLRAALDEFEACASTSATREARRALEVAQERLDGEESKERAHGNPPFLSAAPRSEAFQIRVERESPMKTFRNQSETALHGSGGVGEGWGRGREDTKVVRG